MFMRGFETSLETSKYFTPPLRPVIVSARARSGCKNVI